MSAHPVTFEPAERQAVDAALATTRAVRRRLDLERPVELDDVRAALALAHQGPSGGAEQPVRWAVLTDPRLREQVGRVYRQSYAALDASRAEPEGADAAAVTRVRSSSAHLADVLGRVPVLVLACTTSPLPAEGYGAEAAKFYASVYPAVWSLQLALRARGLGSCLTTVGLRRPGALAVAAELPQSWTCCAVVPVAHVRGTSLSPASRLPLDEVVRWT